MERVHKRPHSADGSTAPEDSSKSHTRVVGAVLVLTLFSSMSVNAHADDQKPKPADHHQQPCDFPNSRGGRQVIDASPVMMAMGDQANADERDGQGDAVRAREAVVFAI